MLRVPPLNVASHRYAGYYIRNVAVFRAAKAIKEINPGP